MRFVTLILSLLLSILLVLIGCDRSGPPVVESESKETRFFGHTDANSRVFDGRDSLATGPNGPLATKHNFGIVTQFLEIESGDDVGRVGITDPGRLDPSTPLFENRAGNAILAPDGHHVTWGEFRAAEGAVIVKCTRKGTHVVTHLSGLIPNGLYSIQNKLFDPSTDDLLGQVGYTETDEKGRSKGNAARSVFRASGQGEGHLRGMVRSGARPELGPCMLEDVKDRLYEWRVDGVYHIDGRPGLDREGTFVEQTGFTFEPDERVERPIQ